MSPRLWWVGAFGGAAAGIVYLFVQQVLAVLAGQPVDALFRLLASFVLGGKALGSGVSTNEVLVVGTVVTLILATGFGLVFSALVRDFPGLAATAGTLVIAGGTYGGGLWLLGFYGLGTFLWPWLTRTDPATQLFSAAVGYGASLGLSFVLAGVHRSSELE